MIIVFKALILLLIPGLWLLAPHQGTTIKNSKTASITYSKDIAPILNRNCVSCHRPGNIAPMSLRTYDEVKPWSELIREMVVSRQMPPWHAAPAEIEFANERRLSDEEIKKMKAEAEANAEADRKVKEETEKINQADSMIFNTEKQLKDYDDKLSSGNKEAIQRALSELKDAHKERNITRIDTALAGLNAAWQAASEEMYKSTSAEGAPGAGPQDQGGQQQPGGKSDGEVTDVDFEEVKDEKK